MTAAEHRRAYRLALRQRARAGDADAIRHEARIRRLVDAHLVRREDARYLWSPSGLGVLREVQP